MNPQIPPTYAKLWKPYRTSAVLYHLTTQANLKKISKLGHLEPRDPHPKHWSGIKAIFLSNPRDPLYKKTLPDVLAHVQEKNTQLVRLHITTKNQLYKSVDPKRTFQVISLDPIPTKDILKIESV